MPRPVPGKEKRKRNSLELMSTRYSSGIPEAQSSRSARGMLLPRPAPGKEEIKRKLEELTKTRYVGSLSALLHSWDDND